MHITRKFWLSKFCGSYVPLNFPDIYYCNMCKCILPYLYTFILLCAYCKEGRSILYCTALCMYIAGTTQVMCNVEKLFLKWINAEKIVLKEETFFSKITHGLNKNFISIILVNSVFKWEFLLNLFSFQLFFSAVTYMITLYTCHVCTWRN